MSDVDGALAPDQATDERALSEDWGAATVGRDVIRVEGPDAASFLQGQLSQDVASLAVATPVFSFLLQPQGKVVALLRVLRVSGTEFLLDTDTGFGEGAFAALTRFKLRVKCGLEQLDLQCIAVRGPNAPAAGGSVDALWPGWAGYDLFGADVTVPDGARVCSAAAFEVERIAAGVPVMGAELDERTIPAESGLVERAVSFTKGCYTGQELVARIDSRGHVNRHLRRLRVEGDLCPPPGAAIAHVGVQGKDAGVITSTAWSASRGHAVALGYVRREVDPPSSVELIWDGGRASALVQP